MKMYVRFAIMMATICLFLFLAMEVKGEVFIYDSSDIGLDIPDEDLEQLTEVDKEGWAKEVQNIEEYYTKHGNVPATLKKQLEALKQRLG